MVKRPAHINAWRHANNREVPKDNEIHHINLNHDDNRPENLVNLKKDIHTIAHQSVIPVVSRAIELGIIKFDRHNGLYYLDPIIPYLPMQKRITDFNDKPTHYFSRLRR